MLKTLVIPLQLVCQFVIPENINSSNTTVAISTPSPNETVVPILPDGYTAYPDIGAAYKYFSHPRTWNLARKECAKDGGYLAIIDSPEKIKYVMELKGGKTSFGIFVGFHRLFDDVEWVNVKTGLTAQGIPWIPGNTYEGHPDRKCMSLHEDGYGVAAAKCDLSHYFVCEIGIEKLQDPLLGKLVPN